MKHFKQLLINLLSVHYIRIVYCRIRFLFLKSKIQMYEYKNQDIGKETVRHNLNALLNEPAAFGMGGRMAILLYPIASLLRHKKHNKVLIVGPRTEDDIFWAKSLGLNAIGLDLFSYSKLIQLGDIHKSDFDDNEFDAVLLGWMISYSSNPDLVIQECKRILKTNGFLAIGIESNSDFKKNPNSLTVDNVRVNCLNSSHDLINICTEMVPVYINDIDSDEISYDCGVVTQLKTINS
ncbi:MAG: methyltransferase domain-containing protein [Sulfuricurvum sp.]|nr:methyltransferase domain-containing protein [Sulfuricurvum sp.]MDP3023108.1 methyltransferase domain-containing protein [Sulfuricurvum sp.]